MAASKIFHDERGLLIKYVPDGDGRWPLKRITEGGEFTLRKSLTFLDHDILERPKEDSPYEEYVIHLGEVDDGYWYIPARILGTDHDLYIGLECKPEMKWFVVQGVSVFGHIFKVVNEDLYIGGNRQGALPETEFRALVESFPFSKTELWRYANSRIETAVSSYFSTSDDFQGRYQNYMENKAARRSRIATFPGERGFGRVFDEARCALYEDALSRLVSMVEGNAGERDFQTTLPPYLKLIFPQYIAFAEGVMIPDFKRAPRKPDYLMIDARGNVDVLEIKRPFDIDVMLAKGKYRSNCIPSRVLSGTVMQCQKYIAYLLNGGAQLEDILTKKLVDKKVIHDGLKLRFTSSRGLVLIGRDPEGDRLGDFDIIRRHYSNMVDVITYDDLIRRFSRIVEYAKSDADSAGLLGE